MEGEVGEGVFWVMFFLGGYKVMMMCDFIYQWIELSLRGYNYYVCDIIWYQCNINDVIEVLFYFQNILFIY